MSLCAFVVCSLALTAAQARLTTPAREWAAQQLIHAAWTRSLQQDRPFRPWPGLNSVPVAEISIPALNRDFVVMSGDDSSVLVHAAGWNEGTQDPGAPGISLISGYHDRSFAFMRNLQKGMTLVLTDRLGRKKDYVIESLAMTPDTEMKLPLGKHESILLLATDIPLSNWTPGKTMHLLAIARETVPRVMI
jgi:sortase A